MSHVWTPQVTILTFLVFLHVDITLTAAYSSKEINTSQEHLLCFVYLVWSYLAFTRTNTISYFIYIYIKWVDIRNNRLLASNRICMLSLQLIAVRITKALSSATINCVITVYRIWLLASNQLLWMCYTYIYPNSVQLLYHAYCFTCYYYVTLSIFPSHYNKGVVLSCKWNRWFT